MIFLCSQVLLLHSSGENVQVQDFQSKIVRHGSSVGDLQEGLHQSNTYSMVLKETLL